VGFKAEQLAELQTPSPALLGCNTPFLREAQTLFLTCVGIRAHYSLQPQTCISDTPLHPATATQVSTPTTTRWNASYSPRLRRSRGRATGFWPGWVAFRSRLELSSSAKGKTWPSSTG